jgi:hypothetical protein
MTKSEAQDLMYRRVFVYHESEPENSYTYDRVGNIDCGNGYVKSMAEFWYNRRSEKFDNGWFIKEC